MIPLSTNWYPDCEVRGRYQYTLRYDWPAWFIQGVYLVFLSVSGLWFPIFMNSVLTTYDEGHIPFSPGFSSYNSEFIVFLFNICGNVEVPTEQLIDLWEYFRKQLTVKWGKYYRLYVQFYSVVQIPTENKSMEKKRYLNIGFLFLWSLNTKVWKVSRPFPCYVRNGVEVVTGMKSCGAVRTPMEKLLRRFFLLFFGRKVFS